MSLVDKLLYLKMQRAGEFVTNNISETVASVYLV